MNANEIAASHGMQLAYTIYVDGAAMPSVHIAYGPKQDKVILVPFDPKQPETFHLAIAQGLAIIAERSEQAAEEANMAAEYAAELATERRYEERH